MTTAANQFFRLSPNCAARARLEEAERYFLDGNLNEALAAAQQAWREHPDEPDVFRILAYMHMALGEYPPAAQAAYRSVVLDGENPASFATLAQVYLTFNMLTLAEETLRTALYRFPSDPTLLTLGADVNFRRGMEGRAVEQVTLALQHNPGDGYAKALLGTHHLRRKHYTAAVKLLKEAVDAYPQRWDFLRDYGKALVHSENFAYAQQILVKCFRLNPLDVQAKHYLFLAFRLGKSRGSPFWTMSFFFFRNPGWGWFLNIIGLLTATIGSIWSIALAFRWENNDVSDAFWPAGFLIVGLALIIMTQGGITLQNRKGHRFDALLAREVKELEESGRA